MSSGKRLESDEVRALFQKRARTATETDDQTISGGGGGGGGGGPLGGLKIVVLAGAGISEKRAKILSGAHSP